MTYYTYTDELYHHGIKGQKWGRRRFQNEDGSLTSAGRERYSVSVGGATRRAYAKVLSTSAKINRAFGNRSMASSKEQIARRQLKKADAADKAALAKREARDRAFAKKHLGMNDSDYDAAMKTANGAIARQNAGNKAEKPSSVVKTRVEDFEKKHGKLVKTAKVAANIATLGATGRIEKSEKAYREAQKRGAKESAAGLVVKGALRAYAIRGNKQADRILRTAAASAAAAAYVASSGNPKVKAGAMVAGKIFSAMATTSLALSTSYNVYAQARDTANYVKQKTSKKKRRR